MKTAITIVAVFAVWATLVVVIEWRFPPKHRRWERMEEMMNDGPKTSLRLLGLGAVSVMVVIGLGLAFELF
jgi:uncharacterized protein YjeT (DUF2065 family)